MFTLYHIIHTTLSYHGEERNGPGGVVVNGYEVDQEGGATDQQGEQGSSHQHLLDPIFTCQY